MMSSGRWLSSGGALVGGSSAAGPKVALDHSARPSMIGGHVSPRKATGRPPGRPKGSKGEPRELLLVRVRPDQATALRRLAAKETKARGGVQLDLSAVLRRLLDKALRGSGGEA